MALFSDRFGFSPKKALQIEAMDDGLRNRIWSVLWQHLMQIDLFERYYGGSFIRSELWDRFLRKSIDDLPDGFGKQLDLIKGSFQRSSWHRVFDILEFIAQRYPSFDCEDEDYKVPTVSAFVEQVNQVLEEEGSGYRFIGNAISPVTSQDEINEVESALDSSPPVAEHLQRALELLSDREQPDYRNSIKEAISAVESIANLISGGKSESLGRALPQLESQLGLELHGAFRRALENLYGWTSDAGGVRHAMVEESGLTQEDARFMLIVCSAFVNYLKTKAVNTGISLDSTA